MFITKADLINDFKGVFLTQNLLWLQTFIDNVLQQHCHNCTELWVCLFFNSYKKWLIIDG